MNPLKAEIFLAACREGSQRFEAWEGFDMTIALNMEGTTWQGTWAALGADCDPWLTFSKEMGTSVLKPQ